MMTSFGCYAKPLVIYSKVNGAPKQYLNDNQEPTGYAVEIAKEAAIRAGYQPIVKPRPWKRALLESKKGKGLITGFSRTFEREEHYLFTEPMYEDQVILVFKSGNTFKFDSFADLSSKRIGIGRGSNYSGPFSTYRQNLLLEEDDGHVQRLSKLASGRLDAAIFPGNIYTVNYNARSAGFEASDFVKASKVIASDSNHIGIPRSLGSFNVIELERQISSAIKQMKADGTVRQILEKYK